MLGEKKYVKNIAKNLEKNLKNICMSFFYWIMDVKQHNIITYTYL
jgi:hypothetical protein